jgi:hypothetical protein
LGLVTSSTRHESSAFGPRERTAESLRPAGGGSAPGQDGAGRPLVVSGAIAASAVTVTGLGILTLLVVVGWIAAPHSGLGLTGVLRTATGLWLAAHHVGFTLKGAGRIGMLPLGLVLLPGALLWRAGRWVVRTGEVTKLPELGFSILALAAPYAALCGALALACSSPLATPSLPEAVIAGFVLALCAGGLGAARALAPWSRLARLLPPRSRSVVLGSAGSLTVLAAGGAMLAGASLALHMGEYRALDSSLSPGLVGGALLLLVQLAYVPNAVGWAVCYSLGPGFAFGTATVVAPTGAALGPLPIFPMLAALPAAPNAVPGWGSVAVLALPYVAGAVGGILVARAAPTPAVEVAPLWGFASGVVTGCVTGVLAAVSGGPLGSQRLAAVGPSGWQAAVVATLEVGVSAAIAAGIANWLRLRRDPVLATARASRAAGDENRRPESAAPTEDNGHRIYLNPWADRDNDPSEDRPPLGPSVLP